MRYFATLGIAFPTLVLPLCAPPASAQVGLDTMLRELGERAIDEMVRPDPSPRANPPTPAPQAPPAPSGPTRVEVREVQQLLGQLGYEPGLPDGLMGPNTARAISAFQGDSGRPQTGAVTDALIASLRSAAADPSGGGVDTAAQQVAQPSFDCARAGTPTEFAICGTPELALLDRHMADAYATARADATNPSTIVNAQRNWISRRNSCGDDVDCLRASMEGRLAALGGAHLPVASSSPEPSDPVSSSPDSADLPDFPTARRETNETGQEGDQPAGASVREDGMRIHSSGRLIVPHPVRNTHAQELQQYRALTHLLRHAVVAERISDMAPAEHPSFFADIARDYLSPSEVQPFFCTPNEMTPDASDCMSSADASYSYASAGGQIDKAAEHPYLWWRGATEFERRRNMSMFAESGLLDQVVSSAPDMPIKLLYSTGARLTPYDFDAGHFPVAVSGGAVRLPGTNGTAFNLDELARPVSVSPAAAEPLLQNLSTRDDGRSELTLGVEVDIALEDPGHASQRPGWDTEVVSAAYFLDADATQPLAEVIETASEETTAAPESADAPRAGDAASDSVMRNFDLLREDGRITIDFEGDGRPTPEAIHYLFASAAHDFVEAATGGAGKYGFPVLFSILSDAVRTKYFGCSSVTKCYDQNTGSPFIGENEFEARQTRVAFEEDVAPKLVAEAPSLPIQMRFYLDAKLGEYDFDDEGFGVRVFQNPRLQIDPIRHMVNFQPILDLVPDFISLPPDSAERLVNAVNGDPVLRVDYDVLSFTALGHIETVMKVRPVAVALVTREDNDTVHFEQSYATADQTDDQGDAARAFLGPEIAELAAPQASAAYPVMGVAPGMTLEEAVDALSQSFSEAEITVADSILRAERGYCGYDGAGGGTDEDELGAICFVAGLKDRRVSRVALRQIVRPGQMQGLIEETRARFGAPDSRGDGDVPAGSMLREYFGWGEELAATRPMLGRPDIGIPAHEAEVDHIVVNPRVAIYTLRADAPAASDARNAVGGGPSPEAQTAKSSSRAPEAGDDRVAEAGDAPPEPLDGEATAMELTLLGIAPGLGRAEVRAILENRFDDVALEQAEDGTLIVESGTCHYAAVSDPAIETEAGSTCVIVVFEPDDAVSNIVARNVVAGSYVDAYAAQLEGTFGVPADRARTEQAPETLILGWGPELDATAAELERDASAGQRLHALEARLTQANGVTLVTVRLDTEPAASGPVATGGSDAGDAAPPIDF